MSLSSYVFEQATKPMTRQAVGFDPMLGMYLWMLINPSFRESVRAGGGVMLSPTVENLSVHRAQLNRLLEQLAAMPHIRGDANRIAYFVDSILSNFGMVTKRWTQEERLNFLRKNFSTLGPLALMFLGPDTYDTIFGSLGSQAVVAKGIIDAYFEYGITGEKAAELAGTLLEKIKTNPTITKEFTNDEIAKLLQLGVREGLLPPSVVPDIFIKQVENYLALLSAVKTKFTREGQFVPLEALPKLATEYYRALYAGLPYGEAARRLRADLWIASVAPYGSYQAAINRLGIQSTVPPEQYAKDDAKLMALVAESPVGNMIGVTVRLVKNGAKGPILNFYNEVLNGNVPKISIPQWLDIVRRSGVNPNDAYMMFWQKSTNVAALNEAGPKVLRALRSAQFQYDIRPIIDAINAAYPNPEVARGMLDRLAKRMGYRGIGAVSPGQYMLFLHSPEITSEATKVIKDYTERAAIEESSAHLLRQKTMPRRIADVLLNRKPVLKNLGYILRGMISDESLKELSEIYNYTPEKMEEIYSKQINAKGLFEPMDNTEESIYGPYTSIGSIGESIYGKQNLPVR